MPNYYNNIISVAVFTILQCASVGIFAKDEDAEGVTPSPPSQEVVDAEQPKETAEVTEPERSFDVLEYRVIGNSVLAKNIIEETVYPWMGEGKSIKDVEGARTDLEKAYHAAGYLTVLVDIPEQDVNQGVVTLNVTEGKVERLRIKGSQYYSLGRIKTLAPSLAEGGIPHFPDVQKDMATLNRTADRRVTPVMKAGKTFGTVEVDLKVEDKLPLHASLEVNDRYSNNTVRWRLEGSVRYDNLWQREHSLTLGFQTSPEDTAQVKVLSANYLYRFDDSDTLLAFYGVKSDSNVSTVGGINVLGKGNILGARVILPLPSLETYFHTLSLGLDYKDFSQDVLFGSDTASTPVKYLPFAIQYSATSQGTTGVTQLGIGVNFGIRGLVGKDEDFNFKRTGAKANFFTVKPELQHTQTLPWDMQLWAKLDAQFAGEMLISNEQFAAGGADSVRGYLESETLGDHAIHASLELRSPALRLGDWLNESRLIGFYDFASVRTIDNTGEETSRRTIAGAGLGVQLKIWQHWNANLAVAVPLHGGDSTVKHDVAGHVRLWYEF